MNDFFEQIFYEHGFLNHNTYTRILYQDNNPFYTKFGLLMLIIPLAVMAIFYFINKYPFGKWWHWLITWIVAGTLVFFISKNMLNAELAVYVLDPDKYPEVSGFVMDLSLINLVYALVVGFAISFIYKQVPGPQSTLPFCIKKK
jgi:MFS superfamily sulfate permease-like transporter